MSSYSNAIGRISCFVQFTLLHNVNVVLRSLIIIGILSSLYIIAAYSNCTCFRGCWLTMFLQRMYLMIILGVLLIILLSIFGLNLIDHKLYLLCGDNNEQDLNLIPGIKLNYINNNAQKLNSGSENLDNKIRQSLKQPHVEVKQNDKKQSLAVVNQGVNRQQSLPAVTSNPLQQLVTRVGTNDHMYHSYLKMLSPPQIKSVINQLGVTNLTLQGSHVSFLSCGGRLLLKQLKGKQPKSSVHSYPFKFSPLQKHVIQEFRTICCTGKLPRVRKLLGTSTTGISYRHLHWCYILWSSIS